jgi:type II restriction/modification system DNA methylase subunit YeeA
MVIAREDDCTLGILQSRFHEFWSLSKGGRHGVGNDPRYSPSTTFDTFPFPEGLTPANTAGPTETLDSAVILPPVAPERRSAALTIAEAAHRLNTLRENWLNPPAWVDRVPEVVPGYPDRIIPKPEHAAEIKKRTLTNLYNARPTWLDNAHKALNAAVASAYGWEDYTPNMADEEILRRLLALNLTRSKASHQ